MTKFFALATDKKFAYQATFTGEERQTVDILPISKGLLQVNGADVRVVATFTYSGRDRIAVEHRSVGGRGWLRFGANAWQRLTRFGAAQSMAAFAAVHAPPDVVYGGPITTGGKTVYRVSMKSVIVNPIMIPFTNLSDAAVTDSALQLLIDAAGRPLSGTATITGRGRISGQLQEIVIDLKLAFIKVGQKVTISARERPGRRTPRRHGGLSALWGDDDELAVPEPVVRRGGVHLRVAIERRVGSADPVVARPGRIADRDR